MTWMKIDLDDDWLGWILIWMMMSSEAWNSNWVFKPGIKLCMSDWWWRWRSPVEERKDRIYWKKKSTSEKRTEQRVKSYGAQEGGGWYLRRWWHRRADRIESRRHPDSKPISRKWDAYLEGNNQSISAFKWFPAFLNDFKILTIGCV